MPNNEGRFLGIQVPKLPPSMTRAETEEALDEFVDIEWPAWNDDDLGADALRSRCSTCGSTSIPCECPE